MKTCNICKEDKPLTDYHKCKKSGYQYTCKVCKAEKQRESPTRLAVSRAYYRRNKEKHLHLVRMRQLRVKKATPSWITEDQKKEIEYFYWLCDDLYKTTGERYEVDHIVPIKGKNISGLHVPWNLQILPQDLNRSKGNSYSQEKPEDE